MALPLLRFKHYGYPLVVRAVSSEDAMTADWSKIPYKNLEKIASRVIGEVPGINRVCLDITSKPPGTIEWEKYKACFFTEKSISFLLE